MPVHDIQGLVLAGYDVPLEQVNPENPEGHVHVNFADGLLGIHDPPFRHGELQHGSTSAQLRAQIVKIIK